MNKVGAPLFRLHGRDARVDPYLKRYPAGLFDDQLYQSIELMERYSIDLALDLLARSGAFDQLHDWRSGEELCCALGFRPQFGVALSWLLRRLLGRGLIETRSGDCRYRLAQSPWQPQLGRLRAIGLEISSRNAPTLDLLDYVASLYPAVARGEEGGEQALFAPRGITLWLNYFSNDNLTYAVNNWVSAVAAVDCWSSSAKLDILEVGAGAGSASEILLRCLAERNLLSTISAYLLTEPNAFFQRRAQRLLSTQYPVVPLRYAALDMNLPWTDQGISSGTFDLIYGVNVFHVAKDLRFTLSEAKRALKPGGRVVIGECIRPFVDQPMYPELIFQILESFTDVTLDSDVRPNPGFLTPEQWTAAFSATGFVNVEINPDIQRIREIYPNFFTGAVGGENR